MPSSNFEELLLGSIESALSTVFDPNTMKAVNFYVDKRIAVTRPDEYSNSMRKLFGDGAKVLIERIIEGVSKGAGLEAKFATLEECAAGARAKMARPAPV